VNKQNKNALPDAKLVAAAASWPSSTLTHNQRQFQAPTPIEANAFEPEMMYVLGCDMITNYQRFVKSSAHVNQCISDNTN